MNQSVAEQNNMCFEKCDRKGSKIEFIYNSFYAISYLIYIYNIHNTSVIRFI